MSEKCPICLWDLTRHSGDVYECSRCGVYSLNRIASNMFAIDDYFTLKERAIISHMVRKMQKPDKCPAITKEIVDKAKQMDLPTPQEQADNFILWLGDNYPPSKGAETYYYKFQPIMGALDTESVNYVLRYLNDEKLIAGGLSECTPALEWSGPWTDTTVLLFHGWEKYHILRKGKTESRTAFMAMKFCDESFAICEECFKPAIRHTGFELYTIIDEQKAGSIDDRLRVEIRRSRFLIADLTHGNAGAYWEAGYAEGLGKPVIYTCDEKVFKDENTRPHFDTNHHLTILWDRNNLEKTAEELKATIRATLPDEAKMEDDKDLSLPQ